MLQAVWVVVVDREEQTALMGQLQGHHREDSMVVVLELQALGFRVEKVAMEL